MNKVLFIEPTGAPSNVFAKFMTVPLLGPIYLATIVSRAGYDVEVINENLLGRHVTDDELGAADVLCLSCITATVKRGKEISRQYRRVRHAADAPARVLFGGIHASMMPEDLADDADQIITGECEHLIVDAVAGKLTDKIVQGAQLRDLDQHVPIPDFDLVRNRQAIDPTPIMTSRGCPYDCNFCSVTRMFGRRYRTHCNERIIEQLKQAKTQFVFFVDDHFAANPRRTNELMDMILAEGIKQRWTAQLRTEVTKDPKLVAKMRKAGCHTVYMGFESINPASLKDLRKNQTVEDIQRSIRVFHDHGIAVHGMFMFGGDSDTVDVFPMTSDFCLNNGIDYVQYCILTPLPGTPVYRDLEAAGRLLHKDWQYYDALHAVFRPKQMTAEQLQQGMIDCFSDFYTYTNAINDAINAVWDAAVGIVQSFYKPIYFPRFRPSVMKAIGHRIVNSWVARNRDYIDYLRRAGTA